MLCKYYGRWEKYELKMYTWTESGEIIGTSQLKNGEFTGFFKTEISLTAQPVELLEFEKLFLK